MHELYQRTKVLDAAAPVATRRNLQLHSGPVYTSRAQLVGRA